MLNCCYIPNSDAHADATQNEIWEVFREVCARTNIKGAILERDENFPDFSDLIAEIGSARKIVRSAQAGGRAADRENKV